jgi:plasmid stability protein
VQTNVQIDDDVYEAVKRRATAEHRSIGKVLSDLLRKALEEERRQAEEIRFPVFSVPDGTSTLTLDMVKAAESDDL